MATAFESITTRQSWYAGAAIPKYNAVMVDTDGKFVKSDGSRPFVGICEYAAGAEDDMVTVVKGSYPVLGNENVTAGALLTIDSTAPGTFRVADTSKDPIYGTALTGASKGDLFTACLNDAPLAVA